MDCKVCCKHDCKEFIVNNQRNLLRERGGGGMLRMSRNGESKLKVLRELGGDRVGVESHCYVTWERRKKGEGEIWWIKERREGEKLEKKRKVERREQEKKKRKLRFYRTFLSPQLLTQLEGTSYVLQNARDKLCWSLKVNNLDTKFIPWPHD